MTDSISFDEIDAAFQALGYGLVSDPNSEFINDISGADVSFAPRDKESIATFAAASRHWARVGRIETGKTPQGWPYWIAYNAAALHGQGKRDVVVIELPDARTAIYGMN
jgi:hypothetical protein